MTPADFSELKDDIKDIKKNGDDLKVMFAELNTKFSIKELTCISHDNKIEKLLDFMKKYESIRTFILGGIVVIGGLLLIYLNTMKVLEASQKEIKPIIQVKGEK